MPTATSITLQEAFLLQGLLQRRTTNATKEAALVSLVQDAELKTILQQEFARAQQEIREMQSLLQASQLSN